MTRIKRLVDNHSVSTIATKDIITREIRLRCLTHAHKYLSKGEFA